MTVVVFECDMFLVLRPCGLPSAPFQAFDKFFSGCRAFLCIQNGGGAVHEVALFGLSVVVQHGLIFVLLPADHFLRFDPTAVKVFSFFCNSKTALPAELVRKLLLPGKVTFGLVELMSVEKRNRVRHNVTVQMLFVLMDRDHALEAGEEPVREGFSDLEHFFRRDLFHRMKGNDVMRVHPAGVLFPQPLFFQPCPVDRVVIDLFRCKGAGDLKEALLDLFIPEHIFDHVSHCAVGGCFPIDDLIDCHTVSLSFR